jgi:hypothetical protein
MYGIIFLEPGDVTCLLNVRIRFKLLIACRNGTTPEFQGKIYSGNKLLFSFSELGL